MARQSPACVCWWRRCSRTTSSPPGGFRSGLETQRPQSKRSNAAGNRPAPRPAPRAANMAAIYRRSMAYLDKFVPPKYAPLWNHPAGKGARPTSARPAGAVRRRWRETSRYLASGTPARRKLGVRDPRRDALGRVHGTQWGCGLSLALGLQIEVWGCALLQGQNVRRLGNGLYAKRAVVICRTCFLILCPVRRRNAAGRRWCVGVMFSKCIQSSIESPLLGRCAAPLGVPPGAARRCRGV